MDPTIEYEDMPVEGMKKRVKEVVRRLCKTDILDIRRMTSLRTQFDNEIPSSTGVGHEWIIFLETRRNIRWYH